MRDYWAMISIPAECREDLFEQLEAIPGFVPERDVAWVSDAFDTSDQLIDYMVLLKVSAISEGDFKDILSQLDTFSDDSIEWWKATS